MKRLLVATLLLSAAAAAQAQMADPTASLKTYAVKAMPRCPEGVLTLEEVPNGGVTNFEAYTVTLRSSDKYCGGKKFLLYSPKTQTILIGAVLPLAANSLPTNVRVEQEAARVLGGKVAAAISPFPIADGLKPVKISRETRFGPFAYHGFVDAGERFLIVGSRGSLQTDPAKTLRESLDVAKLAVRKGNKNAKVEIIEFSDFQCPTCARAHDKIDPIIEKNLSKVNYGRIDLPLFEHHEWAVPAAMAARAIQRVAPAKYWAFVDYVFKNQEAIGKRKFDTVLAEWLDDHDVDAKAVQNIYASKAERQALLDHLSKAFSMGIAATPTFIVNGQIMGFGPDGTFTLDAIRAALGLPKSK
ncbi:MAG TPA: thioredoxin domain-containing protein [Thermoanaerobaculia bacterium]|nr:thioredoxin domain-containing protein [Thermoanaerobaculia bacterium]